MTKGLRFIIVLNIVWLVAIIWGAGGYLIYSWRLVLFGGLPLWLYLIFKWIISGK